jgi:hypothetical protein
VNLIILEFQLILKNLYLLHILVLLISVGLPLRRSYPFSDLHWLLSESQGFNFFDKIHKYQFILLFKGWSIFDIASKIGRISFGNFIKKRNLSNYI